MKKLFYVAIIVLSLSTLNAQQFNLQAELRPRFENKHGFQTLLNTGADGTNFISQRTRLNFMFKQNKINFKVALQNVRVWGDVSTLSSADNFNSLHEAWASILFNKHFQLQLGRQEIVYDDSRIFGNVGWAQQARSHDAAIVKINFKSGNLLDLGFALSADNQGGIKTLYSNISGYKNFQYAWYHAKMNNIAASFLVLNTGIEVPVNANQTIEYAQTFGGRIEYEFGKIAADAASYFQTGTLQNKNVSAQYFSGNLAYKISSLFTAAIGAEYLSGKDMNDLSPNIKSFNPLFGTNHKFNGWMDYFYVGNHINSVGLLDLQATITYKKNKVMAKMVPHVFSAPSNIYNGSVKLSKSLGTEIDTMVSYAFSKDILITGGYSMMFGSKSLEFLKGGDRTENNSWTWLMIAFKPTLFSSK